MIRNVHVSLFSAWNAMSANLILAKALLNIRFCTQPLHKSSAAARWRLFNWSVFMEQYSSAYSSDIERYMPVNAFPSLASCFWELREEYSLISFGVFSVSVLKVRAGWRLQFLQVSVRWCCSAAVRGGRGSASTRSSTMLTGCPSPSANWLHITSRFTLVLLSPRWDFHCLFV